MDSRIYLIGFMGVGKTTFGKKLAKLINYRFVDLDLMFEEKYKLNIDLFFSKYDENVFRKLEAELLVETFLMEKIVVATGGGTACYHTGIEKINRYGGTSIFLSLPQAAIIERLLHVQRKRPLLKDLSRKNLEVFVQKKLNKRISCYKKAHFTIDVLNLKPEEVVQMLKNG